MTERGRVTIEEGVVYGNGGGRELRCDVYTPPGNFERAPAVLILHGGGWRQGDRTQLKGYGILIGREGYVCVAPEYRLVPESPWPAQIHDVKAALRWVRANAEQLRVDPDRIAIEGNSAGAHLALFAAGTPGVEEFEGSGGNPGISTAVSAAVGVYPPTLFSGPDHVKGSVPIEALVDGGADPDVIRKAGPASWVTESFPPTLLIHGTADTVVPPSASLVMYEALYRAGVPVELHMYAEQPHAFDAAPAFGRQCAAEMLLFLDRYVAAREPAPAASARA
jgi:acetyl esterase/lipase